jgi:hypothetical protein
VDRFYVYEHRRADTGAVFYVGKGSGYRLRVEQHRGAAWRAIAGAVGYSAAEAHRRNLAVARKGMKHSAATRAEMSATRRLRPVPRRTCERCGVTMTVLNFGRWHTPCAKEG